MDDRLKGVLADLRQQLEVLYGPRFKHLVLYGSQARGDADVESDVDCLVVLQGLVLPCDEIARTEYIVAEISLAYDVVVACVFISEEAYKNGRSPLLLNVRREGQAV